MATSQIWKVMTPNQLVTGHQRSEFWAEVSQNQINMKLNSGNQYHSNHEDPPNLKFNQYTTQLPRDRWPLARAASRFSGSPIRLDHRGSPSLIHAGLRIIRPHWRFTAIHLMCEDGGGSSFFDFTFEKLGV